jgi:hypothetical protein
MEERSLAEKILRELQYNFQEFTINGFLSFIGEKRGRQIIATPWNMPPTVYGAWMSDGEEPKEYIFYRDNAQIMHQVHIQLHELSHFLLGHQTLQIDRKMIADVLEGKASLPFSEFLRLRSPAHSDLETQAETLAALIQQEVIHRSNLAQLMNDLSSEEKLANFLKTMGLS